MTSTPIDVKAIAEVRVLLTVAIFGASAATAQQSMRGDWLPHDATPDPAAADFEGPVRLTVSDTGGHFGGAPTFCDIAGEGERLALKRFENDSAFTGTLEPQAAHELLEQLQHLRFWALNDARPPIRDAGTITVTLRRGRVVRYFTVVQTCPGSIDLRDFGAPRGEAPLPCPQRDVIELVQRACAGAQTPAKEKPQRPVALTFGWATTEKGSGLTSSEADRALKGLSWSTCVATASLSKPMPRLPNGLVAILKVSSEGRVTQARLNDRKADRTAWGACLLERARAAVLPAASTESTAFVQFHQSD